MEISFFTRTGCFLTGPTLILLNVGQKNSLYLARYAERDHEELVELCNQQTALEQKLVSKEEGEAEKEPAEQV